MSLSKFENVRISGFLTVVPEQQINIDDKLDFFGGDKKKLERYKKPLGLGTRHIVPEGMTVISMCEEAARLLIEQTNTAPDEIDTIIFASQNHDYNCNPSSCIVHGNLGLSEEVACFDTSGLGCTGVVYGLWLAHSLIQSNASKKCLFLEGGVSSVVVGNTNAHSVLFGDAAAAILLERTHEPITAFFNLKSIGRGWKNIVVPAGGFKLPIRKDIIDLTVADSEGGTVHLWDFVMNGMEVFKFAVEQAPESVQKLLDFAKMTRDDIDFFGIHQANGQIVRSVINHARIPKEKASSETFTKYGNCGGTSVLVNVCDRLKDSTPANVMFVTFGSGLSVASCILDLHETYNGGVQLLKETPNLQTRQDLIEEWTKYLADKNS
ncbi:MAG: ketoacyl-ACP synthase III [Spirochaetes bacterium]|nr:ketoacyl-ACP synthase III [Spirochaetota bacterium]